MAKVKLNDVLKQKKMTKYAFAKLIGAETSNVGRYFKSDWDPKLSTLTKIAKKLDISVKDLIQD